MMIYLNTKPKTHSFYRLFIQSSDNKSPSFMELRQAQLEFEKHMIAFWGPEKGAERLLGDDYE